jgi:transcriptional regulator with XRE-family HTH domain
MEFRDRLKELRKRAGLTQRELADMIKSNNNTVSNWEKGVSRPTTPVVEALARALGVSPFLLLGEFTLADIQRLTHKVGKGTPEEEMALTFAIPLLMSANVDIDDLPEEYMQLDIRQLEAANQRMAWDFLLGDGGKELLLAFDHLSDKAKRLLLDYALGLLRVPSYLLLPDDGVDEEIINDLEKVKSELKGD